MTWLLELSGSPCIYVCVIIMNIFCWAVHELQRRTETTSTMSGRSEGSCTKQLRLSFTTWMAYLMLPFSAKPGPMKLRSSLSAFGLSIRAAIVVESSLLLPASSKTGSFSVISSSSTTPKAYTSTFGVRGPAPRHSDWYQVEYCYLLHHCAHKLDSRSCEDREVRWQHLVQYECVGSSSSTPGLLLFCPSNPLESHLPCTRTRAKTSLLKVPRYSLSLILLLDPKFLVALFISENLYASRPRSSFAISRIKSRGENTFAFPLLLSEMLARFL